MSWFWTWWLKSVSAFPALDDSWWILWHVDGLWDCSTTFSNPSIFQSPISNEGLDFGFSNSPKIPPNCPKFVQSPIYYGENWKSKNLPIAQNSPNSPKNLPISNPVAKVQFPKSKKYPTWKVLSRIGTIITILDNNGIAKFVNGWIIQDKSLHNYWLIRPAAAQWAVWVGVWIFLLWAKNWLFVAKNGFVAQQSILKMGDFQTFVSTGRLEPQTAQWGVQVS